MDEKIKAARRLQQLTTALCHTLEEQRAGQREGKSALVTLFVTCLVADGVSRERVLHTVGEVYDLVAKAHAGTKEPRPRGEDFQFVFMPEAQAALDADPELAKAMKDMQAQMREALDGLATGKFATEEEAMRSIGGVMVDLDEDDDDDIAGHA